MGLGSRGAKRHETAGVQRTAGVNPADYWDFKPGQSVMTVDGFMGKVTAVNDGPIPGTEAYEVLLANGMGGGSYTASQLRSAMDHAAAQENTASRDYPELAEVLVDRPDPGRYPQSTLGLVASLQTQASRTAGECDGCGLPMHHDRHSGEITWHVPSNRIRGRNHVPAHDIDDLGTTDDDDALWHYDCPKCGYSHSEYKDGYEGLWASGSQQVDHQHVYGTTPDANGQWSCADCHVPLPAPFGKEAAYYTEAELREIGQAEADRQGKTPEEILRAQAGGNGGLCPNGHLTWGGDCAACRNAPKDQNAMVVNPGDHKPQDVENIKHAAFEPERNTAGWFPISKHCEEDPENHSWCKAHLQYHDFPSDAAMQHEMFPEYGDREGEDGCKTCGASDHSTEMHDAIDDAMHPSQEMAQFMRSNPTGPTKYSALVDPYGLLREARTDPEFRFHVTAAWRDVREKAQRIRHEGRVHITTAQNGYVIAQVLGDHGTYESVLMRVPGSQKVGQWDCGCKWAKYHWGAPDDHSRFAGRMCSHALALHFEAQARGMFGREVKPNTGVPRWLTKQDVMVTAAREVTPLQAIGMHLVACGEDVAEVTTLLTVMGSVNSPWGEPTPPRVEKQPGPTMPRDPSANPASSGFLTAADPESWSQQQSQGLDRQGSLDDALFEPEMPHVAGPAIALAPELLAGAEAGGVAAGAGEVGAAGAGGAAEGGGLLSKIPKVPGMGGMLPGGGHEQKQPKDNGQAALDSLDQGSQSLDQYLHQATLHDEPEPALPSTDGAVEDEDADPKVAAVITGTEYAVPSDVSANSVPVSVNPGMGLKDEPGDALSPESPSIQSTGTVADIVAEFQRTAGAQGLMAGGSSADGQEIAAAAKEFLSKQAMADFSPAQQQEIIREGEHVTAANLDRLDVTGTHYEALDQARASLGEEDEEWMA